MKSKRRITRLLFSLGASLGLCFVATLSAFAQPPRQDHVVILVNACAHEFNGEVFTNRFSQFIKRLYPKSFIIDIRAQSSQDVYNQLYAYQRAPIIVDALVINIHGGSQMVSGQYHSLIGFEKNGRDLLNPVSVAKTFGPILGKFSQKAKIIVFACDNIGEGALEEKMQAMLKIAQNFRLNSGSIYLNETVGADIVSGYIQTPFQAQPSLKMKIVTLGVQVVSPVIYPVHLSLEATLMNRGFTLVRTTKGAILYEDRMFHALQNPNPKGPAVRRASLEKGGYRISKVHASPAVNPPFPVSRPSIQSLPKTWRRGNSVVIPAGSSTFYGPSTQEGNRIFHE